MMLKVFYVMSVFSFLFSGCNQIAVSDIERGRNLEKAVEASVENFFAKRMTNRPRKANVGSWMILFETDQFVYFGYPRFRMLLSDAREVDTLYKTSKIELQNQFPNYKTIEGNDVRLIIMGYIDQFMKNSGETLPGFAWDWKAKLGRDAIDVEAPCTVRFREAERRKTFYLRLNKNDLSLIEIKDEK